MFQARIVNLKFKYWWQLAEIGLVIGVFLLPFVFATHSAVPYEIPRVIFVRWWASGLGMLVCVAQIFDSIKWQKNPWPISFIMAVIWILFLTMLVILAEDKNRGWYGNYYRLDGLVTSWSLFVLAASSALIMINNRTVQMRVCLALFIGGIGVAGWAIRDWSVLHLIAKQVGFWNGGVGVSFGQPNYLAGFLAVIFPTGFYLSTLIEKEKLEPKKAKKVWLKWLIYLGLAIIFGGILVTHSWGAALVSLICGFFWLWHRSQKGNQIFRWSAIGFGLLVAAIGIGYFQWIWKPQQYRIEELVAESRQRIFMKGFLAWQQKPILGWGVARFDAAFASTDWPLKIEQDVYVDKAHSHLLETLVTTGVIGLLIYLIWWSAIYFDVRRLDNQLLSLVMLAYFLHTQTNVIGIAEEVVFWLVLGMIWADRMAVGKSNKPRQLVNSD